jgi:hypothetical protein
MGSIQDGKKSGGQRRAVAYQRHTGYTHSEVLSYALNLKSKARK